MTSATETKGAAAGALRGVRALDFGHYIPSPLLGAESTEILQGIVHTEPEIAALISVAAVAQADGLQELPP